MELEFDKEMDAILRRSGRGVLVGDKPLDKPKHLDADAIAAFVENAVPAPTRRLYMEHFADCDRCRKLLASSILMNETAATAAAPAAVVASAESAIPWYVRLFNTRSLALGMGALVLTFSGVLGYMLLQNSRNADVAMAPVEQEYKRGPSASTETSTVAANAANVASNTAANIAAAPATNSTTAAAPDTQDNKQTGRSSGPTDSGFVAGKREADKDLVADGLDIREQPKGAAAPPPVTIQKPAAEISGGVPRDEERKDDTTLAKKSAEPAPRSRDLPPAPAKSGPTRSVGPVQNQINTQTQNVGEMAVVRNVGGKTFDNRNGAWYDRAYRNQPTTNYRRGTAEYKKLDTGLRSIADNLGGTVVMMWKDKAYRIQ